MTFIEAAFYGMALVLAFGAAALVVAVIAGHHVEKKPHSHAH